MNHWDEVFSKDREFGLLHENRLKNILIEIKKINNNPKTVVDLGCGSGDSLLKFKQAGLNIFGVDFSKVGIEKARKLLTENNINDVEIIFGDLDKLNSLDIPKNSDIYFCKLVYSFIEEKENFLDNVKDLMKDDSVFIINTPVLYKGIKYTEDDKPGMAVSFEATNKLLTEKFKTVRELYHGKFGENGDIVTYLLVK